MAVLRLFEHGDNRQSIDNSMILVQYCRSELISRKVDLYQTPEKSRYEVI